MRDKSGDETELPPPTPPTYSRALCFFGFVSSRIRLPVPRLDATLNGMMRLSEPRYVDSAIIPAVWREGPLLSASYQFHELPACLAGTMHTSAHREDRIKPERNKRPICQSRYI